MPWIYNATRSAIRPVPTPVDTVEARIRHLSVNLPPNEPDASNITVELMGGLYEAGEFVPIESQIHSYSGQEVVDAFASGLSEERVLQFLRSRGKLPAGGYQP